MLALEGADKTVPEQQAPEFKFGILMLPLNKYLRSLSNSVFRKEDEASMQETRWNVKKNLKYSLCDIKWLG